MKERIHLKKMGSFFYVKNCSNYFTDSWSSEHYLFCDS